MWNTCILLQYPQELLQVFRKHVQTLGHKAVHRSADQKGGLQDPPGLPPRQKSPDFCCWPSKLCQGVALAKALEINTTVTNIDLSWNGIGDKASVSALPWQTFRLFFPPPQQHKTYLTRQHIWMHANRCICIYIYRDIYILRLQEFDVSFVCWTHMFVFLTPCHTPLYHTRPWEQCNKVHVFRDLTLRHIRC